MVQRKIGPLRDENQANKEAEISPINGLPCVLMEQQIKAQKGLFTTASHAHSWVEKASPKSGFWLTYPYFWKNFYMFS